MRAIGGYFGLEISQKSEHHVGALRLNTGRNALEYILLTNNYSKIYIPYYTCGVILQPILRNGIEYEYYHIDERFDPVFDFSIIKEFEAFLYTNYFGLKDECIVKLVGECNNLIIDNAQAFYSKPFTGIDTFYSPRKFFGVPDGAYLFTGKDATIPLTKDFSWHRFAHLLKRVDQSAEFGYADFKENEDGLNDLPIMEMSVLTQNLLQSIDYADSAAKRRNNFLYLSKRLNGLNRLAFNLGDGQVPMVYPFYSGNLKLRNFLTENKVYTGIYWKEVKDILPEGSHEYKFANNLVHLPVDQRYNENDLAKVADLVLACK